MRLSSAVIPMFSANPAPAPASDSSRLSASNWRTSRPRPAPIETRTAISCDRLDARASRRLATFAHAISSTNPTIAISMAKKIAAVVRPWNLMRSIPAIPCTWTLCDHLRSPRGAVRSISAAAAFIRSRASSFDMPCGSRA